MEYVGCNNISHFPEKFKRISLAFALLFAAGCGEGFNSATPMVAPEQGQAGQTEVLDAAAIERGLGSDAKCTDEVSGFRCVLPNGIVNVYAKPIGVYVPKNLDRQSSRLNFYFHGHNSADLGSHTLASGKYIDSIFLSYLGQWYWASGRREILIEPTSSGVNTDFNALLTAQHTQFQKFLDAFEERLGKAKLLSAGPHVIGLLGHSGAHSPIYKILSFTCEFSTSASACIGTKIDEIFLFDATFISGTPAKVAAFARFAARPDKKFKSIFLSGADTERGSYAIAKILFGSAAGATQADFCRKFAYSPSTFHAQMFSCVTGTSVPKCAIHNNYPHYCILPQFVSTALLE